MKYLVFIFLLFLSFSLLAQDEPEQITEKEKSRFAKMFRRKDKKGEKAQMDEKSKTKQQKGFLGRFRKKKKRKDADGAESKWPEGQDLTPEESEKVEAIMEKYKLTKEEMFIKSMYKNGEPLNRKGRKKLRKVHRKEAKRKAKLHKFHIKRNRNIQDKKVKKRMKKNRRKSNRRMKKRYR